MKCKKCNNYISGLGKTGLCLSCVRKLIHKKSVEKLLAPYKEALIWCSASEDFQAGGKARKGWLKICVPLLK